MLIIDRFSFYKTVVFLKTKSADVMLNILEAYYIEAE